MAAAGRSQDQLPTWMMKPTSKLTSELQLHLCGSHFTLDRELLVAKSEKVTNIISKNPHADLSGALRDIPADQESMELLARFCHGFQINLNPDNVVRVACVAHYLGMTETQCPNNLLSAALIFLERQILPSWSYSVKAIKSSDKVFEHAIDLGIIDFCVESVINMAVNDPRLLGEPITDQEDSYQPNARRKLFDQDWKSEDLTELPLRLYAPIIRALAIRNVPEEYIAANVCQYAKKWIFSNGGCPRREIIEVLETLLPDQPCTVPWSLLMELLKLAINIGASLECRRRLEMRIGKQLDRASVKDLLIIFRHKDEKYDVECIRRVLKIFFQSYASPNPQGLNIVADHFDKFLEEIALDIDLKAHTFLAIEEMSVALGTETGRASDGLYRAIDAYLEKHKGELTEWEKEAVCQPLDLERMTNGAREHAARNQNLPVRVILQVLSVSQARLREAMVVAPPSVEGGGAREVKRESEDGSENGKKKMNVWKAMKRKFGCVRMEEDVNCHVNKKKPRQ